MSNGKQPSPPRLLVCEGAEDRFFFERLIEARKLHRFCIQEAGGRTRIAAAIDKFRLERTKEFNALRGILVVADNDDDPKGRFNDVCGQINLALGAGAAPAEPLKKAQKSRPPVTVLMIPRTGVDGHLERLCVDAAFDADKTVGAHVNTFMGLLHAETWTSESRRGKAWLRTSLAARCVSDPFVPLGEVFRDKKNHKLIPVDHKSFNQIADVLAKFEP